MRDVVGEESDMSTMVVRPSYGDAPSEDRRFERDVLVHLDRVYAGARWMTSGQAAAEELVGRTFERAVRDFHWARPAGGVVPWLYGHLVGAWFDSQELRGGAPRSVPPAPTSPDEVIRDAKDALAPIVRVTLYLVEVENLSVDEVARITEVPPGIVESRVRRAHRRLADQLKSWLDQPGSGRGSEI
ncbi:RNA polymerase sigma factor [Actinacidiphila alni]|uniref:RNA polymerase sigma factor n=1 Tax=Actinacidiphila alni TaxID=380248 RepID=UPI0034519B67